MIAVVMVTLALLLGLIGVLHLAHRLQAEVFKIDLGLTRWSAERDRGSHIPFSHGSLRPNPSVMITETATPASRPRRDRHHPIGHRPHRRPGHPPRPLHPTQLHPQPLRHIRPAVIARPDQAHPAT